MISLKQAAQWCGGCVLPEYESVSFFGAENDSRVLQPGQLFVALRAARDGHDFIENAMQAGAVAALGERQLPGIPMIVVPDSLRGLQKIAEGWRKSLRKTKVIALTGSVGKTTTKELCATACSSVFRTAWTQKNYNNEIGVPKTVLSLHPDTEVAVVEMGMNHFGEISRLSSIARPDVAVITNIGSMHLEHLGSREGICRAKLEILEGLLPDGTAVLNYDEPLLRQAAPPCRTQWFGHAEGSALRAEEAAETADSIAFTAVGFGQRVRVKLPIPGLHNVANALAALLAAHCVGVSLSQAAAALKDFRNVGDRLRMLRRDGFTIIADCYNAGPESMKASLRVLRLQPTEGRRIAVLGDMLELGTFAADAHRTVGELAAEAADLVLAFGPLSRNTARSAGAKGRYLENREALLEMLRAEARPGDVLLFKGSHGMHLEAVLEAFLNHS